MQKVTKNPDSYRDKAAAIAPRAQPCQRSPPAPKGEHRRTEAYNGSGLLGFVWRALEEEFGRSGWQELRALYSAWLSFGLLGIEGRAE